MKISIDTIGSKLIQQEQLQLIIRFCSDDYKITNTFVLDRDEATKLMERLYHNLNNPEL